MGWYVKRKSGLSEFATKEAAINNACPMGIADPTVQEVGSYSGTNRMRWINGSEVKSAWEHLYGK